MIKLSFNLPKYRLNINFTKRRSSDIEKPLLPKLSDVANTRSGSRVSRYFRHVFEHKNIRKFLGTNLALFVFASSLLPASTIATDEAQQAVISPETPPLVTERVIQYPTDPVVVTQGYSLFHPALDLDGLTGDEIRPIKAGRVEAISRSKYAYGNAIVVDHGNEITSLYAHLSKILVSVGQEINTNSVIGLMGATGRAFGDHLHLEVRDNGKPVNPLLILPR